MSAQMRWDGAKAQRAAHAGAVAAVNALTVKFQNSVSAKLREHGSTRAAGNVPSAPGEPPAVQTAQLLRSWTVEAVKDESGLSDPARPNLTIGSNLKYAAIHEFGGTISGNPVLAMPIHPDAKRAAAQGLGPRSFGDSLDLIPRPNGPPLLVRFVDAKRTRWDIMYVLMRSVTLPARPYVRPAIEAMQGAVQGIAQAAFTRVFKQAMGGPV